MTEAWLFLPQIVILGPKWSAQVILPVQGETVEAMSAHVLEQAPARFTLVGHGLGGAVALDVLCREEERVTRS